jgi:translation initiation factor 3 subunit B
MADEDKLSIYEAVEDVLREEGEADLMDFVSEGEGEDMDSLEPPVKMDASFPSTLIICNVPKVGKEKHDKLMNVLSKIIDKNGPNQKHMPFNDDPDAPKTEGFVIATFDKVEDADAAIVALDGMSLDKSHTFKVVKADQFDEIINRQDDFVAKKSLTTFSRCDFREWLADSKCREQLLLRYQAETEIYWNDTMNGAPVLCYGGEREKANGKLWCDWKVQWSPQGTYLATFHAQGIALWAGPEFTKKVRFGHKDVKHIQFSPDENFLLTWNGSSPYDEPIDDNAVRVWRVLTGELVRKSRTPAMTPLGGDFPHFLWSNDGKYFAECNDTGIFVRDTETGELIKDSEGKKKKLPFEQLDTFQWSPRDNYIAAWTLEKDNNPARLTIMELPSRRELASRSRTQVEASMHWQSEGDYLCLLVTKLIGKQKKKGASNLEIFRIREKNIPVDGVEIKDMVEGFFWETKGNRFAVLVKDEAGNHPRLLFYQLGKEKCENIQTFVLPSNSFTQLLWAPEGQYFVCAELSKSEGGSSGGQLLFGGLTSDNRLEILHKDEHFMLTNVSWDPSSRFVLTAVAQPMEDKGGFRMSMEAGYKLWSFQGRVLHQQQKEKLWHIAWRPHPPLLLPAAKQKEVRRDIKKYSKKYDEKDEKAKDAARAVFRQERETKMNAFMEVINRLSDWKEDKEQETDWADAVNAFLEGQGWDMEESTVEEVEKEDEELISG